MFVHIYNDLLAIFKLNYYLIISCSSVLTVGNSSLLLLGEKNQTFAHIWYNSFLFNFFLCRHTLYPGLREKTDLNTGDFLARSHWRIMAFCFACSTICPIPRVGVRFELSVRIQCQKSNDDSRYSARHFGNQDIDGSNNGQLARFIKYPKDIGQVVCVKAVPPFSRYLPSLCVLMYYWPEERFFLSYFGGKAFV